VRAGRESNKDFFLKGYEGESPANPRNLIDVGGPIVPYILKKKTSFREGGKGMREMFPLNSETAARQKKLPSSVSKK